MSGLHKDCRRDIYGLHTGYRGLKGLEKDPGLLYGMIWASTFRCRVSPDAGILLVHFSRTPHPAIVI